MGGGDSADGSLDGSADPPRVTKEVDTVNQGASGRAMARKPDREAAPPLTARASTLGDRLDLYRAERDTLDLLREKDEKEEVRQSDIEGLLDQVVRDFQRVLITARVNLAEVFTAFDKDGDGTVTIKEFRTGLRALKVNVADELVAKLIEMMDRDGDGEIDYREFTKQFSDKGGQFSQPKPGEVAGNPRFLSREEHEDAIRGFRQICHARKPGTVELLTRWTLNVDVLHGLTHEQRLEIVENVEVLHVKAGEEVVHEGSVGTATTFFIVLSGACCIWLPPLDSETFAAASSRETSDLQSVTESDPADRAKKAARKWIDRTHDMHAQSLKVAHLQRVGRQREATGYSQRFAGEWAEAAAHSARKKEQRRAMNGSPDRKRDGSPGLFTSLTRQKQKRVYVPGKGFKYIGKNTSTARKKRASIDEKIIGLVNDSLEADRLQRRTIENKGAMDELTLASTAKRLVGHRELADNHVEMSFPRFSAIGEKRAFHNADHKKVLETGTVPVGMTVRATADADVKLLAVYRIEDVEAIMQAYQESTQDKVRFLQSMPQYKSKSDAQLENLAEFLRRAWHKEGDTVMSEGEEADSVYFVVSGQLAVSKTQSNGTRKVVNVLGAGTSMGQIGVVQDDGKRTATCTALTDCELFIIHKYNFLRCSDPKDIEGMRIKLAEIARLSGGDLAPTVKLKEADSKFLSGRSAVSTSGKSTANDGLAAFRAIKLSQLKKGTSVNVTRNKNPLLPKADSASLPAEKPSFEPPAPTEERGRETLLVAGSPDVLSIVVGEDSGGAKDERQETGSKSRGPRMHAEDAQTPEERTVSHGKQQRDALQRPKTADAAVHGRAAGSRASSSSRERQKSGPAGASEYQKGQRLRSAGLTVATTGLNFDRRDAGPFSPFASPFSSTSTSPGGRRSTTVPGCKGMAASPEGTFLLHRLRGLATTRRLSARLAPTPPRLQGGTRPHTSRSPRGSEWGGGARVCRAHPDSAGVQLFPWGVSPQSPRGKLIVHQSRLPQ